jgi:hypothetical protein
MNHITASRPGERTVEIERGPPEVEAGGERLRHAASASVQRMNTNERREPRIIQGERKAARGHGATHLGCVTVTKGLHACDGREGQTRRPLILTLQHTRVTIYTVALGDSSELRE